jgi:hypothetical protein
LVHWCIDSLIQSFTPSASWIDWFIDLLIRWLTGSLNHCSIDALTCCFTDPLNRWTNDSLICCFIVSLIHWTHSRIHWFIASSVLWFIASFIQWCSDCFMSFHRHFSNHLLSRWCTSQLQQCTASASQKLSYRPLISYSNVLFAKIPPRRVSGTTW